MPGQLNDSLTFEVLQRGGKPRCPGSGNAHGGRRFLATVGRRLTAQALARREPERRYPILLTLLAQSATEALDEVVQLFDQAVSARESKAAHKMRDVLAERAKSGEDRQALLDALLAIVAEPAIADEQVGGLIRGEKIGWERLRAAQSSALPPLPRDHGHLAALDGSYRYLRQFTPQVLDAVRFAGGTAAAELLEAVEILRELNASGARKVPENVPTGFVLARWRGYLDTAAKAGNTSAYRHYWELCTPAGVTGRAAHGGRVRARLTPLLRSGRLSAHPEQVGRSADGVLPAGRQTHRRREGLLHTALGELEQTLGEGDGPVRLDDEGDLVISPLSAEDVPAEATALKAELTEMLPFAPIVSLLIEMDKRTGFLDCFTHAGGKQARSPELKRT